MNSNLRIPVLWTFSWLLMPILTACEEQHAAPKPPPSAPEVTVQRIEARTIPIEWEFVGQTESSRLVEIRTRIEGFLNKRFYEEGMPVHEGQSLFQMDERPFIAALQSEKGSLAQQIARQDNAQRNVARLKNLILQKAISQKDMDDAISELAEASAAVLTARAKVTSAELDLSYTTIKSPLTGLAGQAKKHEGSFISPGDNGLLTTVIQTDPMWVKFTASENRLLKVNDAVMNKKLLEPEKHKYVVTLQFADGSTYPINGKMNFSEKQFSAETGTTGFRAVFSNPDMMLLPGQFVRVKLKGATRPDALLVPQRSVMQGQQGKFIYVVGADDKAEIRPVEMGDWYGEDWIIESGLKSGEQVIVDGMGRVKPNMPVKPLPANKTVGEHS